MMQVIEAGLTENQAEAIIKCQSASQSELATKSDLRAEVARLETAMAELKTVMAEQESRLIKWVVGSAGIVVALIKFLP